MAKEIISRGICKMTLSFETVCHIRELEDGMEMNELISKVIDGCAHEWLHDLSKEVYICKHCSIYVEEKYTYAEYGYWDTFGKLWKWCEEHKVCIGIKLTYHYAGKIIKTYGINIGAIGEYGEDFRLTFRRAFILWALSKGKIKIREERLFVK